MKKIYSMINNKKGFTLMELIIVIAILGILATIAIPRLDTIKTSAQLRADEASAATVNKAIDMYCAINNKDTFAGAYTVGSNTVTIQDGSSIGDVVSVLVSQKLLKTGTTFNNAASWTYEDTTNQVE